MNNSNSIKDREVAFENIIKRYSVLITKVCYYFSTDTSELKDLRQDVLLNIWAGIPKFNNNAKLSTWIYRICFNTCITYKRKNKNKKNNITLSEVLDVADDSFDIEKYKEMHRLINKLGSEDRSIILMWLDENSYEEIAEVVGIKRNTVATKLKRIKEKLVKLSNE